MDKTPTFKDFFNMIGGHIMMNGGIDYQIQMIQFSICMMTAPVFS